MEIALATVIVIGLISLSGEISTGWSEFLAHRERMKEIECSKDIEQKDQSESES